MLVLVAALASLTDVAMRPVVVVVVTEMGTAEGSVDELSPIIPVMLEAIGTVWVPLALVLVAVVARIVVTELAVFTTVVVLTLASTVVVAIVVVPLMISSVLVRIVVGFASALAA